MCVRWEHLCSVYTTHLKLDYFLFGEREKAKARSPVRLSHELNHTLLE